METVQKWERGGWIFVVWSSGSQVASGRSQFASGKIAFRLILSEQERELGKKKKKTARRCNVWSGVTVAQICSVPVWSVLVQTARPGAD